VICDTILSPYHKTINNVKMQGRVCRAVYFCQNLTILRHSGSAVAALPRPV
jgi:hypothetical protein